MPKGIPYNKNFGGKKLWRIRTVGSLAEKLWQIEVHLHRECYGKFENWRKTWQNAVICHTRQSFFATNVFYCMGIGKFSMKHNRLKPTSEMAIDLKLQQPNTAMWLCY